jgi:hypothetical protein
MALGHIHPNAACASSSQLLPQVLRRSLECKQSPSITAITTALLPPTLIAPCHPISPRSVPHSEEACRQYHRGRHSGGLTLGKFGPVLEHTQTLDGVIFGIELLTAPV